MSLAKQVQKILQEPKYVFPVLQRAIKILGEARIEQLVSESLAEYGSVWLADGSRLRSLGGIFLAKLKATEHKHLIFKRRQKKRRKFFYTFLCFFVGI